MRVLLKINDVIDVEVLQKIQDSFSDATGLAAVTVDYKGNPVTKYSNFSEFCNCVRKDSNNRDLCYQSDAHGGIESARSGKPAAPHVVVVTWPMPHWDCHPDGPHASVIP